MHVGQFSGKRHGWTPCSVRIRIKWPPRGVHSWWKFPTSVTPSDGSQWDACFPLETVLSLLFFLSVRLWLRKSFLAAAKDGLSRSADYKTIDERNLSRSVTGSESPRHAAPYVQVLPCSDGSGLLSATSTTFLS